MVVWTDQHVDPPAHVPSAQGDGDPGEPTPESIAAAKAAMYAEREEAQRQTGIVITDEGSFQK